MKIIAIAPNIKNFCWQVDLAYFQLMNLKFNLDDFIVLSPVKNHPEEQIKNVFPNYINRIDTVPFWEYMNVEYNPELSPINIQTSLMQYNIEDDCTYVICDADMVLIKNINFEINDNEIIHENVYENWHMKLNSKEYYKNLIINNFSYSGFVPIIIKGITLKRILPDWYMLHQKCFNITNDSNEKWWAGMYSYNLACAKNNINVKENRICALPFEEKITNDMFMIHYSVAFPNFDKHNLKECLSKEKILKSDLQSMGNVERKFFEILKYWAFRSTILDNYKYN